MIRAPFAASSRAARLGLACLIVAALAGIAWPALAQSVNLVAVEEDWELVLTQPDPNVAAPQITCCMSPNNTFNDTYWTFEINHLTAPSFSPGGLHMHRWSGEWRQATFSRSNWSLITTANDTITWTQSLRVASGRLAFEVQGGNSATWGPFGFGNFELDMGWGVPHINSYSHNFSVASSGVGFGSNRVTSLKIKQIRKTYSDGATVTDNTQRIVFQQ